MDSTGARARHPSSSRPYYVAPSPEDFLLDTGSSLSGANSGARGAAAAAAASATASASSSPLGTVKGPSRYATVHGLLDDSDAGSGPRSLPDLLRYWASASALGYASTACVMPFEVGKILLQIQWIPKADVQILNEETDDEGDAADGQGEENVIYDVEELSDEDDAQAYFHDLNNSHGSRSDEQQRRRQNARGSSYRPSAHQQQSYSRRSRRGGHASPPSADHQQYRPVRPPLGAPSLSVTTVRDASGYIVRRSIFEVSTKPEWILPFTVTGGVWEMMKSVGRWKGEGWWSLWKGQLTTLVMETLSSAVQPFLYSCIAAVFLRDSPFSNLPLVHIPSPMRPFAVAVLSHVVTGFLLSPLDLIRTRLVAQSSQTRHKKYSGPIDAFNQIREEEGGLASMYLSSTLWAPAIVDATFRSVFHLGVPLFIERRLHLAPDTNPIIYGLTEFTVSTFSLLFTLPIETIRRRLQVQSRSEVTGHVVGKKTFKTCVETRPTPYYGVVEAAYRIVTEETGKLHLYNVEQKPRRPSLSRRGSNTSSAGGASRRNSYRGTAPGQPQPSEKTTPRTSLSPEDIVAGLQGQNSSTSAQGEIQEVPENEPAPFYAGIAQLYRGFSMSLSANFIVLVLGLIAGQDGQDTSWTEL